MHFLILILDMFCVIYLNYGFLGKSLHSVFIILHSVVILLGLGL